MIDWGFASIHCNWMIRHLLGQASCPGLHVPPVTLVTMPYPGRGRTSGCETGRMRESRDGGVAARPSRNCPTGDNLFGG
jgi:hypothetical protein